MSEINQDNINNVTGTKPIGRKLIKSLTREELQVALGDMGFEKYRADQIFHELYAEKRDGFEEMTTLPIGLRRKLEENFLLTAFKEHITRVSKDGSVKFLFSLNDGKVIEAVYMPWLSDDSNELIRTTLCISTMAGCPIGCAFCATGTMGFHRNLETGEIIDQVIQAEKIAGGRITNVVYMGMGEPLMNYNNVAKSLSIMTDEKTELIHRKRITLSTSGVAPRIKQLAGEQHPVKLAISLHATTDEVRNKIMPVSKSFDLCKLMDSIEYYYRQTHLPVTYEYILFAGLNDTAEDARRLGKIAKRVPSRVNLIPFNDISFTHPHGIAKDLKAAGKEKMLLFEQMLKNEGTAVIIRDTFGKDIEAACGQLAVTANEAEIMKKTIHE